MTIDVKICGITDIAGLDAALNAGARWVGFVFYGKSPRNVTPDQAASLIERMAGRAQSVGLFVDPDDDDLNRVLPKAGLDIIQLHGAETPERAANIRRQFNLGLMKAIGVRSSQDVLGAKVFSGIADQVLFDAKPAAADALPGGNGIVFDWTLLRHAPIDSPWILSGGLTPVNVADAILQLGAKAVDVSSGVEASRGVKDPGLILDFIQAAQSSQRPVHPGA